MIVFDWGYHSSETEYVHVTREDRGRREDLFDVTLYDREEQDPTTLRNCEEQSLVDLREILGYANAAVQAGLQPVRVLDKDETGPTPTPPAQTILERLKADLAYHQDRSAEITEESLDIDTAEDGAYSIEADCEESYHAGRAAALADAINLFLGREVRLYSETETEPPVETAPTNGASPSNPVVVVIRDPDFSNEWQVFGGEVDVHDIDCGRVDLRDPDEYAEWAESHREAADRYEAAGRADVAEHIREIVKNYEPEKEG